MFVAFFISYLSFCGARSKAKEVDQGEHQYCQRDAERIQKGRVSRLLAGWIEAHAATQV